MQTGEFAEAASQLEKATAMRPENGDAWSILGSVYKQMNQPEKAIPALRRAIELLPAQPGPHITLAAILADQGDRDGATAERKKGAELSRIAVSRQRAEFALGSGTALLRSGKLAEAITQLQAAIAADPGYAAPHRILAEALTRQGNAGEAAIERQKADALDTQTH
jgi:Flp pilus assembly protein TadD